MLLLSRNPESPLYDTFLTFDGYLNSGVMQTCTECRHYSENVRTVSFPNGGVAWFYKGESNGHISCIRPVVALELDKINHLIT